MSDYKIFPYQTKCIVLKKVYQKKVKKNGSKKLPGDAASPSKDAAQMLREYFSGVPVESLSKRYGYSIVKIKTLATEYKKGKIDIFDNPQKRRIAMSIMTHQEEVQLLQDKIRALEDALKLSNIKAEGFEVMMRILKDEYGIDLSKKVEAEQSKNSRKDTRK